MRRSSSVLTIFSCWGDPPGIPSGPGPNDQARRSEIDGLPNDTVDRFVRERDPRTGKSQLPWISTSSTNAVLVWQILRSRHESVRAFLVMLDTASICKSKATSIHRYTLSTYNYLNFSYMLKGEKQRVDTQARGTRFSRHSLADRLLRTLQSLARFSLTSAGCGSRPSQRFLAHFDRSPKEVFDEWTMGINLAEYPEEGMLRS